MTACKIVEAKAHDHEVEVVFSDGTPPVSFPAVWLRDHCRAEHSFHPETQQRQIDTVEIPADIAVSEVQVSPEGDALTVGWTSEEKDSYFPVDFLKAAARPADGEARAKTPWARADWEGRDWPATAYDALMEDDRGALLPWLQELDRYGFAFADGAPATPEATAAFAERIAGYIRRSIFGDLWDFTANLEFKDTAYTTMSIGPHTDGTYVFDPPGYQMFHCLEFDGRGGESTLVDGLKIAERLRAEQPELFDVLTRVEVPAQYIGDGAHLKARHKIIEVDKEGRVQCIAYNNYDRAPFYLGREEMSAFYEGIRAFDRLANDPEMEIEFELRPGRILLFDNWRLLHGRRAYSGRRRLAGAYLNKEDVESRLRTLEG